MRRTRIGRLPSAAASRLLARFPVDAGIASTGWFRPALGDAASYGLNGCLDAVLDVKLGEDSGDVVGDGVRAQ
jgi:hypothetical protein